jgi:hypothetical protein
MEKYYKRVFANKQEYKGILFNSTLEKDFALFLDGKLFRYKGVNYWHRAIKWEYETKEFELIPQEEWFDRTEKDKTLKKLLRNKKHTLQKVIYTPDFYLPEYDLYVETKGKMFDDALFHLRLRLFKHKYPNTKIWVVRSHTEFDKIDEVIENLRIMEETENV